MRTLAITLRSADGRMTAEEAFQSAEDAYEFIANGGLTMLSLRLDVLERDGPWKPEVQNSLQPAPKISDL